MTQLHLHNSDLNLTISPRHGGGIVSFEAFGEPVLMPAPDPIRELTDPAAFILVPYCNRIADGEAMCGTQSVKLQPNLEGEAHPLHGEGWLSRWTVATNDEQSADLRFSHHPSPGRWPWAFDAAQRYELTKGELRHVVSVQNRSDSPMPAGVGFHPYFLREADATFDAVVRGEWRTDGGQLPTSHELVPQGGMWPGGRFEPDGGLDHCFTGWDRKLQIARKNIHITLTASPELVLLHVYAPDGATFFCAEPVSHMPNALNHADAAFQMRMLESGETLEAEVSYLIEKSA